MFAHCLYCTGHLGANEVVELFPVGQRLAFDAARGRLWVVCPRCTRWNLSPLEERWEAIEVCERSFRGASRQVGTGSIALAVLPAGLQLVRVGAAGRPEFAAWRYGDQLRRRRNIHRVAVTANTLALASVGVPITWPLEWYRARKVTADVRDDSGGTVAITGKMARELRLRPSDGAPGWLFALPAGGRQIEVRGEEAVRLAGRLLVHINRTGADKEEVATAVGELERAGGAESFFAVAAQQVVKHEAWALLRPYDHRLRKSPPALRLAVEMAAHEESERRALEGELAQLEDAWREAEDIAAIADDLLIPPAVRRAFERLRRDSTALITTRRWTTSTAAATPQRGAIRLRR